jgi:hypothetical protein
MDLILAIAFMKLALTPNASAEFDFLDRRSERNVAEYRQGFVAGFSGGEFPSRHSTSDRAARLVG